MPFRDTIAQSDIDSISVNGVYYGYLTIGNVNDEACTLIQFQWATSKNNLCQVVIFKTTSVIKIRFKSNNAWEGWKTFIGQ